MFAQNDEARSVILVLIIDMLAGSQDDAQWRPAFEVSMRSLQRNAHPLARQILCLTERCVQQLAQE